MSTVNDIKSMRIRGASEIAIASLKHLKKHGGKKSFNKEAKKLLAARPTAVALYNIMDELRKGRNINDLLEEIKTTTDKMAEHGQKLVKRNAIIMTHCHSSSTLAVIKKARDKKIRVIATMTEPREQGKLTARELVKAGIPVTLIVDSAVGYFMPDVDLVLVGADALRNKLINKIGTCPLAITANEFGKPVYVAASTMKLDRREKFKIEMRPADEVCSKIAGVKILNPAFDETPWKYIRAVITEEGIKKPKDIMRLLE
ncbi:MAG: S-methyl-5-thioribose-1-phosphate isomerase [Candidatus Aenigmarchaeota archaeon]|nr:S-methyl-5-thioribose-1-phosphate isomerase [Candidatus Aenigmarchaeota archaeon]